MAYKIKLVELVENPTKFTFFYHLVTKQEVLLYCHSSEIKPPKIKGLTCRTYLPRRCHIQPQNKITIENWEITCKKILSEHGFVVPDILTSEFGKTSYGLFVFKFKNLPKFDRKKCRNKILVLRNFIFNLKSISSLIVNHRFLVL